MSKTAFVSRSLAAVLYPALLLGGCALASALLHYRLGEAVTGALTLLVVVAVLSFFEHVMPYTPAWRPNRRTVRIDLTHSLISAAVASPLVRITGVVFAAWLGGKLSGLLGSTLWPSTWPLALQVALGVIVADFGVYWAHRWMHATSVGWRVHAVHHSPTRLYAVAGGRSHPLNAIFTLTSEAVPVVLLGITPEAYMLLLVFKAVNGMLQHSNIAMTPGPLSYVIATSDVHRFHHATDLRESNSNFGNATMIWDHVFGTFYLPHRRPAASVGIADADVPESYFAHLLTPFTLDRYARVGMPRRSQADAPPL